MKIRVKLAVFAALLIAAAIAASCLLVFSFSRQNAMDRIFSSGVADYERLYNSLNNANMDFSNTVEQTKASYVKYYFQKQYGASEFALQKDEQIVSNNTGVDPKAVLQKGAQSAISEAYGLELTYRYATVGDRRYFVAGGVAGILGEGYELMLVRDVTETLADIDALAAKCVGISAVMIIVAALLMVLLIYRALKPMESLRQGARALKNGDYESRISIKGKTEISELADSFNSMAEAVERHIREIEATSEERKLLLSALSHEMKTPVTAINACSYTLTHTKMSEEQTRETVSFIDSECARLERLSAKLAQLISMQGEGLRPADISIDALVAELRSILRPISERSGIELAFSRSADMLHAEKDLIICLVSNLFDNARKAGATVVRVCIAADEISVSDNGKGIPPEHIEKITQPFYVVEKSRSAEGFGLGLALVKRIAELHNAGLSIESEPGRGTSVRLRFNPYNSITQP